MRQRGDLIQPLVFQFRTCFTGDKAGSHSPCHRHVDLIFAVARLADTVPCGAIGSEAIGIAHLCRGHLRQIVLTGMPTQCDTDLHVVKQSRTAQDVIDKILKYGTRLLQERHTVRFAKPHGKLRPAGFGRLRKEACGMQIL